jgi:hypothetical protein
VQASYDTVTINVWRNQIDALIFDRWKERKKQNNPPPHPPRKKCRKHKLFYKKKKRKKKQWHAKGTGLGRFGSYQTCSPTRSSCTFFNGGVAHTNAKSASIYPYSSMPK